jgi:hypothetical protein
MAPAQELVRATPQEEKAIAAAVVEGIVALGDFDSNKVVASADPMLAEEMAQVRELALALPPEQFLPPFDGPVCVPLWASLRILELRKNYGAPILEALTGEDLLHLAIVDSRSAPFLWQQLLNDETIGGRMRANMAGDPVEALRLGGIAPIYVAGDRAYAAISSYEPAASIAVRQADGTWWPDYRLHLQFYREDQITIEYRYVLDRRDIKPSLLAPVEYLAGFAPFLSEEPLAADDLQRWRSPWPPVVPSPACRQSTQRRWCAAWIARPPAGRLGRKPREGPWPTHPSTCSSSAAARAAMSRRSAQLSSA